MRLVRILASLLALLVVAACSADGGDDATSGGGGAPEAQYDSAADEGDADTGAEDGGPREVITTGSLLLVVTDTGAAVGEIVTLVEASGGRVDERSEYSAGEPRDASASLTVRVPADELSTIIDRLEEIGEASEITVSADDVTLRGRDLDARIAALETSTERLIGLMAEADTSEALIAAEDALSQRQAELESLRSERAYLSDQVAMSTLHISLATKETAQIEAGGFLGGLENGWNALVTFASGLLVALGTLLPWLVVIGVPVAVVLLLLRRRRRRRPTGPAPEATPA